MLFPGDWRMTQNDENLVEKTYLLEGEKPLASPFGSHLEANTF